MTNTIALVTLIATNWVGLPGGDFRRESGTNYVRQQMVLTTNVYAEEVFLCTNRTLIKRTDSGTNGPVEWRMLSPMLLPPPLPGGRTRE